ncbi:MAG TPA: T9SS type A sorting domain-containing protein, partial [Flavobacteriales bacterium]
LEVQFGPYFVTAGRCAGCHGFDSLGMAMVDLDGVSVNVTDDWRSTMMANSARDPFFLAKIEHESLVNPAHAEALQNKCLGCHAPLGMHQEEMLGNPAFTLAMLDTSVMGHDGVSCLACHMQNPDSAGHHFSGELTFDSAQVYGPYPDSTITAAIMEFFVRFRPSFGEHIIDGRVCAGCHTLITETVDLEGNYTGGHFVEQATWQEWKNSAYPAADINCRGCHMPRIDDPVILASEYAFLNGHSPFGKHELVGANTFMLRLMRDRIEELGIPATTTQFDSTIARTERMLRGSVDLDLTFVDRTDDTLFVDVSLTNLAGHKFPSGYPSRRAFVQLIALDGSGDTLFHNGTWDETWEVLGHDLPYEPHHDVITAGDQVQIYEMVMGDVLGGTTTVLERAAAPLKDNRLVPAGFSTAHASYDTTLIAGVPPGDLDFNHYLGEEGNGGDVVHYHVPLQGHGGSINVHARIYYQPLPPQWNQEMFAFQGEAIDRFRDMYAAQEGTPELVAADSLVDVPSRIGPLSGNTASAYPNPTSDGLVRITGAHLRSVRVYDPSGRIIAAPTERRPGLWTLRLPDTAGTYLIAVEDRNGERLLRVVRLSR